MKNTNLIAGIATFMSVELIMSIVAYFTYDGMLDKLSSTSDIPTLVSWFLMWNIIIFILIFFSVGAIITISVIYEFFGGEMPEEFH
jgi:hypothetical protein